VDRGGGRYRARRDAARSLRRIGRPAAEGRGLRPGDGRGRGAGEPRRLGCPARRGGAFGRRGGSGGPDSRRIARGARRLPGLQPEGDRDPTGFRRRRARCVDHAGRRGARRRRRSNRPPIRRPRGQAAGPDARLDRARSDEGLYRQRRAVAAAGKSHADAAGDDDLSAVHDEADRPREPALARLPRGFCDADPLGDQGRDHARPRRLARICHRGRARDPGPADVSSRLSATPAEREALGLDRPAQTPARDRRGGLWGRVEARSRPLPLATQGAPYRAPFSRNGRRGTAS
jgi:hypothetical protein